jgi:hypothetical protein
MKLKKLSQDKHIKIVAATSMTLFSLLTVFSACIAWFGMNKEVGASGQNIVVSRLNGKLASIDFFSFDDVITDPNGITGYKFFPDEIGNITFNYLEDSITVSDDTAISLERYTPLQKEHPLLLIFNLTEQFDFQPNQFRIEAITDRTTFLGAKNEDGTPLFGLTNESSYLRYNPTLPRYYYPLSSVAKFMYQELSTADYNTLMQGTTLDLLFENTTTNENFVTITSGTEESDFNSNPELYVSSEGSVAHIALIIDYFPDAIEYIYTTYLGDDDLEGNIFQSELYFECDWTFEVFG